MISAGRRALVLAPHTDDGEFGCGGTIARLVEAGAEVHYVAFSTASRSLPEGFPADTLAHEVRAATGVARASPRRISRCTTSRCARSRRCGRRSSRSWSRSIASLKPDLVLMPSLGDIHQDHETIAREGPRAFKRTTLLGYEIPWNCFSFQQQAYVSLEARHLDAKVSALRCYRVAAAPKLRQRGVHPQHRPHPRHRERPGAGGGVRGVPVGDVKILVTATGAPGAASLMRGLRENGEQKVTLVGTDMRHQSAGRFLCDHFHEVPAGNDPRFAEALAEVARHERRGLRVPAVVGRDSGDLAQRRAVRRAGAGVQARLDRPGGVEDRDRPAGRGAGDPPPRAASRPDDGGYLRPLPASWAIPG